MRITNKLIVLLMATLLHLSFTGCCDETKIIPEPVAEEAPDFVLKQEFVKIKIGAENKVTFDVTGGGDYSVFCLDDQIAKPELINNVITVEGLANGQTSLIVSDKYSRYRRLPISVFTTDVFELDVKEINLETRLGYSKTVKAKVVSGNGGYEISSDHEAVTVSVNDEGEVSMTAVSKKIDYTATVTVKDVSGFSGSVTVTMKASYKPFTNEGLEKIMKSNAKSYRYKGRETFFERYYTPINKKLENGKQRYGWEMLYEDFPVYSEWFYLDFEGDKSVGVKKNAKFAYKDWSSAALNTPATIEIIKNDGTNIWGVFFHINDKEERMYTGYFCDTVDPK